MSELVAVPGRGLVYGNRGCLHDERRQIRRLYAGRRWISCRLEFRGWHHSPLMRPGHFTELFFLDEATAFAAGHRPCALCRRDDYRRFMQVWHELHRVDGGADSIDRRLHAERLLAPRTRRLHAMPLAAMPDGAFVLHEGLPWLVRDAELLRWTPDGYSARIRRRPSQVVDVITPPSLIDVLRRGWIGDVPFLHPSASA